MNFTGVLVSWKKVEKRNIIFRGLIRISKLGSDSYMLQKTKYKRYFYAKIKVTKSVFPKI